MLRKRVWNDIAMDLLSYQVSGICFDAIGYFIRTKDP